MCVEDVDVDVDVGVKVESFWVWEMLLLLEDDDDDVVKFEIFDVVCEEVLGIDCVVLGEDFGFVNVNWFFGFFFVFRIVILFLSFVICYW